RRLVPRALRSATDPEARAPMTTTSTTPSTTASAPATPPASHEVRDVLLGHAKILTEVAHELGLPELARTIEADTRRRLDDHRVRAVVLGEIKQGKSTLINAILGDDALPTGVTPTTGAVATVRVGDEPGTFLYRDQRGGHEGSDEQPGGIVREPVDLERFAALATGREQAEPGAAVE